MFMLMDNSEITPKNQSDPNPLIQLKTYTTESLAEIGLANGGASALRMDGLTADLNKISYAFSTVFPKKRKLNSF